MKTTFLILVVSLFCSQANSQARARSSATGMSGFSIGLEAGVPLGENGKPYSYILGGSLQYETKPASDIGITFSGGYLNYTFKEDYGSGNTGFVPLLGGVKYYFSPSAFLHAQVGAAVGTKSGQGTSFMYTPGIGFKLSRNIEATVKYVGISNSGGSLENVGARLAYNF
jgi:hypothetical protein